MEDKEPITDPVREFLAKIAKKGGLKGGKSRSPAKVEAARQNIVKALEVRRKKYAENRKKNE
jgi:hypothetical protein